MSIARQRTSCGPRRGSASRPGRIVYNRYLSRTQMGSATGQYNTNGFAEPERLTVHTLFPWDNHETVHVYYGAHRPSFGLLQ